MLNSAVITFDCGDYDVALCLLEEQKVSLIVFGRDPSVAWRPELLGDEARQLNPSSHVSLSIQTVHEQGKRFESPS